MFIGLLRFRLRSAGLADRGSGRSVVCCSRTPRRPHVKEAQYDDAGERSDKHAAQPAIGSPRVKFGTAFHFRIARRWKRLAVATPRSVGRLAQFDAFSFYFMAPALRISLKAGALALKLSPVPRRRGLNPDGSVPIGSQVFSLPQFGHASDS
jgi:hypothetical protein